MEYGGGIGNVSDEVVVLNVERLGLGLKYDGIGRSEIDRIVVVHKFSA